MDDKGVSTLIFGYLHLSLSQNDELKASLFSFYLQLDLIVLCGHFNNKVIRFSSTTDATRSPQ